MTTQSFTSVTLQLGNVSFELKEAHSFDWIYKYGHAFCVFDEQDSGNIAFGVEQKGRKRFIKYAGARTKEYMGEPEAAIERLKAAIPLYTELKHPNLIELVEHFDVQGGGYAGVFEWFEGECLHSHWSFPPPAKYHDPRSPFYRHRHLSMQQRLNSLDVIFSFHEHVEAQGYVAVDFYDGSILYDFITNRTKICDIDFYRRSPAINDIGEQFWGAMRSKSPEEYELGALIDSRTNVYNLGAIAFGLLGGERNHALERWEAGQVLYEIALQAVQQDREQRFPSIAAFKSAWDEARGQTIS
ncbi:serine/threonine protein kinase [Paenibacillus sp. cl6col]|uniref:Serine/threonine protein kinase n=1 Tax=Paenibacillus alvei TaxID=44250 RepID=A0ABT4EDI6_PAEAL|nr:MULTISPECIES: serine/threonine protein kinase [Paenibacillus]MCY9531810.1 serine/threonine protein kinase [Paenibacillus alvei]SDG07123.1 serine/threonine protein kinase [Paenibacillus sp. cl6col]